MVQDHFRGHKTNLKGSQDDREVISQNSVYFCEFYLFSPLETDRMEHNLVKLLINTIKNAICSSFGEINSYPVAIWSSEYVQIQRRCFQKHTFDSAQGLKSKISYESWSQPLFSLKQHFLSQRKTDPMKANT